MPLKPGVTTDHIPLRVVVIDTDALGCRLQDKAGRCIISTRDDCARCLLKGRPCLLVSKESSVMGLALEELNVKSLIYDIVVDVNGKKRREIVKEEP